MTDAIGKPHASTDDCTTTESFEDHGIEDGSALIRRTYYRLAAERQEEFEPTEAWFDRLADAFLRAYLTTTAEHSVPDHVEAAIDDARIAAAAAFADAPEADLRTAVIPGFYQYVAGFHCRYRPE